MLRTTLLNPRQLTLTAVKEKTALLSWRELAFAVIGGIALAGVERLLGPTFHSIWPVPMSGSVAVTLPRTLILLAILLRTKRFGALTVAGIAEVSTRLAMGFVGFWPMSLVVPVLAGVAGDIIWQYLRHLPSRRTGLILTGGCLSAARILLAMSCWLLLMRPFAGTNGYPALTMAAIVVINIVLGMAAGLLVGKSARTDR
jgi:hypothetical protein